MIEGFPDVPIRDCGEISHQFLENGIRTFHEACLSVRYFAYGRPSEPYNIPVVLKEKKGTCSGKHALIASLANELNIPVKLVVGMYKMSEENTPGVGKVLDDTEYSYIPEAHVFLMYEGKKFDFTRESTPISGSKTEYDAVSEIYPDEIGTRRQVLHRDYLANWAGMDHLEYIWNLRERCIKAISS